MIFDENLSTELDRRLREKADQYRQKQERKRQRREALKEARAIGKAMRHSAREHPREETMDNHLPPSLGEELPDWLRDDAPYQRCGRCGRKTWDTAAFDTECRMPQPDGYPCGGGFEDEA